MQKQFSVYFVKWKGAATMHMVLIFGFMMTWSAPILCDLVILIS